MLSHSHFTELDDKNNSDLNRKHVVQYVGGDALSIHLEKISC
jgi:hypothetical protein